MNAPALSPAIDRDRLDGDLTSVQVVLEKAMRGEVDRHFAVCLAIVEVCAIRRMLLGVPNEAGVMPETY